MGWTDTVCCGDGMPGAGCGRPIKEGAHVILNARTEPADPRDHADARHVLFHAGCCPVHQKEAVA